MAEQAPAPGPDEILLSVPAAGVLCHDREHRGRGRAAAAVVTFGRLADPGGHSYSPGSLWPECWGQSFPMCPACWERARRVAAAARPGLAVRDARPGGS